MQDATRVRDSHARPCAPEPTPSATTNSGLAPSSMLYQSSLTAWRPCRASDATAVSSRIHAGCKTPPRVRRSTSDAGASRRDDCRSRALATFMQMCTASSCSRSEIMRPAPVSACTGTSARSRRRAAGSRRASTLNWAPGPCDDSVDGHPVVAVNDNLRTRLIERDDFEMATRDFGVRPVDDERLTARATRHEMGSASGRECRRSARPMPCGR